MTERRATIRLSADELREAKVAAAKSDMSLQRFVAAAIREKIERRGKESK